MSSTAVTVAAPEPPRPALRAGGGVGAIVPQDAEQAWRMAQMIAKSGLAPKDMRQPEQIVTAIFHGLEIGLKPMQAVQSIAVVNGRPTVWGDAALGLVEGSGLLADFAETIEGDGEAMLARCVAHRVGRATPIERTFSVADAKKAGLWGKTGPWTQYPKRMLQLRARAFALRDGFADVLKGLQITEEARDFVMPPAHVRAADDGAVTADALRRQAAAAPALTDQSAPAHDPETGEVAEVTDDPPLSAYAVALETGGPKRVPQWPDWGAKVGELIDNSADEAELDRLMAANGETLERLHREDAVRYENLMGRAQARRDAIRGAD